MTDPRPVQIRLPFDRPLEQAVPQLPRRERRSLVIEAGAGTGKTTSIVRELLEILTVHEELSAERVVLVTFTEKAAGEISGRIREAIVSLHRTLDRPEPSWPEENPIFTIPAGEREARRAAVERHFRQVERFQSQTIHSFCQRILRMFPLEAGVSPHFSIIQGFERASLYDEIYDRWLQTETAEGTDNFGEWETVLEHFRYLNQVRMKLFAMIGKRDLIVDERYSLGSIEEAEPMIQQILAGIANADATEVAAISHGQTLQVINYIRTHEPPSHATIEGWLEYFSPIAEALPGIHLGRAKSFKIYMEFLKGRGSDPTIVDRLRNHRAAVAMRKLAVRFVAALEEEKQRLGVLDFDDLLFRTATLLENDKVLNELRDAFDYIFVDEFQDTDRVQAEIVDKLARGPSGSLAPGRVTIVGDPKQSIYSFRRADPETYERTVTRLLDDGADRRVLSDQYRSDPPLVDELNKLFGELFSRPSSPSVARPSYEPLVARKQSPIRQLDTRITFLRSLEPSGGKLEERQAVAIAEWILERRREGSHFSRFAILLRKLTNVEFFLETLDRHGVPYVLPPTRAFLEKPAAVDLLAVLRAIAFPFDQGAMIAAARSPWFALDDREIAERLLVRGPADVDSPWERFRREVERYALLARELDVESLITLLTEETGIEPYYAALRNGRRSLLHLDAMRDIAAEFDLRTGGSVAHFVEEMERRREETGDPEPVWLEAEDAVTVMTVHAAKGLEFETVILPDLGSRPRGDDLRILAVDEPPSLLFSGKLENLAAESRHIGGIVLGDIGKARADAEVDRLFYVAVTRAKSDVVFVTDSRDGTSAFWQSLCRVIGRDARALVSLFPESGRKLEELGVGFVPMLCAFETIVPQDEAEMLHEPFVNPAICRLIELPPLAEDVERVTAQGLDPGEIARRRASGSNRAAGILLHRFLELWNGEPSGVEALLAALARGQGADASATKIVRRRIERISASPVFARIRAAETVGVEFPIHSIGDGGRLVERRIDRLLHDQSGYIVLDYKSGRPRSDRLEEDRQQVIRYCEAVSAIAGEACSGYLWYIDADRDELVEVPGTLANTVG